MKVKKDTRSQFIKRPEAVKATQAYIGGHRWHRLWCDEARRPHDGWLTSGLSTPVVGIAPWGGGCGLVASAGRATRGGRE